MALAELQAAAARLSVDAAARRALREDPDAFARESGLDAGEVAVLQEKAAEFERFARSLVNKRSGEAGRAIPLTRAALGEAYHGRFASFAEETGVARDPALDALAFLKWLRARKDALPPIRELARYELAALRFRRSDRRLAFGLFHFRGTWRLAAWWRAAPGASIRSLQWPGPPVG